MTLDEIFARDFRRMMMELKRQSGYVDLKDIPVPPEIIPYMKQDKRDLVVLSEIDDEYYGRIGKTLCVLWGRSQLMRRKFDYKGEYMKDKAGNDIWTEVTCPTDCVAVVSDISIGVPLKYKPKEHFEYVDMISREVDGKREIKYVYIVPKKYCYKCNLTALVLSWVKLRVYYSGVQLAMQNGHSLFLYIIPYKATRNVQHNYRVIMTKPSIDYDTELAQLRDFWIRNQIIFNPAQCELLDEVRGETNPALHVFEGVLDDYEMFDIGHAIGEEETMQEFAEGGEDDYV